MSWFWNLDWVVLGSDARKLALLSSYPPISPRLIGPFDERAVPGWDWHRWNGSAGGSRHYETLVRDFALPDVREKI